MPTNLTTKFLTLFLSTPLERIARFCLLLLEKSWRRWPNLTLKLSDFIPIGGVTNILQGIIFLLLLFGGSGVFAATFVSVLLSALFNFVSNRFVTWRHEFVGLSRRQNALWFTPLFVAFYISTPTVILKNVGINSFDFFFGLHPFVAWIIFSGVGLFANFFGADLISFGVITRIIRWVTLDDSPATISLRRID